MTSALPETLSKMIACETCGHKVTNENILKAHIKNKHSNEKKYKCTKCNYSSSFKNSINIHLEGFHGNKKNEVSFSKSPNSSIPPPKEEEEDFEEEEEDEELNKSRLRHLKSKSRNGTPGKALKPSKNKLVTLEEEAPKVDDDWSCGVCEVTFSSKSKLEEHSENDHRHEAMKTWFKCSDCKKQFEDKDICMEHINTMACKVELLTNLVVGGQETPLPVEQVDQVEQVEQEAGAQGTTNPQGPSSSQPTRVPCTKCSSNFLSKKSLNIHMKSHKKEMNLKCTICGRLFDNLRGLTTHTRFCKDKKVVDKKRKKYQCEECEKTEVSGTALIHHMKTVHDKRKLPSVTKSPPPKKQKEEDEEKFDLKKENAELKQRVKRLEELLNKTGNKEVKDKEKEANLTPEPMEEGFQEVKHRRAKHKGRTEILNMSVSQASGVSVTESIFTKANPCTNCEKIFETRTQLKTHENIEHKNNDEVEESSWNCKECTFQANNYEDFAIHCIESGHKECKHDSKCKKCKKIFPTHSEVIEHIRTDHPSTSICRDFPNCPRGNTCLHLHEVREGMAEEVGVQEDVEVQEQMDVQIPRTQREGETQGEAQGGIAQEQVVRQEVGAQGASAGEPVAAKAARGELHRCKWCEQSFSSKRELSSHIKTHHKNFKPCREFAKNRCGYDGDCWFSHVIPDENTHICFQCGNVETTKTLLMNHIKNNHGDILCTNFRNNTCRFSSNACIFSHELPHEPRPNVSSAHLNMETDFPQAWQVQPPDQCTDIIKKVLSALPMILQQMIPQILPQLVRDIQRQ